MIKKTTVTVQMMFEFTCVEGEAKALKYLSAFSADEIIKGLEGANTGKGVSELRRYKDVLQSILNGFSFEKEFKKLDHMRNSERTFEVQERLTE